jgi:type II secretory pathway pseudopilin PulG
MKHLEFAPAKQQAGFLTGFTLVELTVTMVISLILILAVGIVIVGGQRAWQWTYNTAQKKIKQDAEAVMITFGNVGRKSNRLNYVIYNISGSTFTPALPVGMGEEVVYGDAVEFRYWDVELDLDDTYDLMNDNKTATAYALFYLDGDQLKIDYGSYPPGAVPSGGGVRNNAGISKVLAENVTTDSPDGAFSHTTESKVGQGSVRINITITDPKDGETINVMTATLMRNIWPR